MTVIEKFINGKKLRYIDDDFDAVTDKMVDLMMDIGMSKEEVHNFRTKWIENYCLMWLDMLPKDKFPDTNED